MKNKRKWLGILAIVLVFGMAVVGCASTDNGNGDTYSMVSYLVKAHDERGGLNQLYGNDGSIITHDSNNLYFIPGTKSELQAKYQQSREGRSEEGYPNQWDSSQFLNDLTLSQVEHYLNTGEQYEPGQADDNYKNFFATTFSPHASTILNRLKKNDIVLVTSIYTPYSTTEWVMLLYIEKE